MSGKHKERGQVSLVIYSVHCVQRSSQNGTKQHSYHENARLLYSRREAPAGMVYISRVRGMSGSAADHHDPVSVCELGVFLHATLSLFYMKYIDDEHRFDQGKEPQQFPINRAAELL